MLKKFQFKYSKAFSLIELSVIITVLGILAAGTLALVEPDAITDSQKANVTKQRIDDINKAILSFRVNNSRLPCPADLQLRNNDVRVDGALGPPEYPAGYTSVYGQEMMVASDAGGLDCPVTRGAVPINSLGLPDSHLYDGWNRRFVYHVTSAFCRNNQSDPAVGCSETDFSLALDNTINPGNSTFISVTNRDNSLTYNDVAYVVLSHGPNGMWGYLSSANQITSSSPNYSNIITSSDEAENGNTDQTYNFGTFDSNNISYFDDILSFKTMSELKYIATDAVTDIISHNVCLDNQNAIAALTASVARDMASTIDYFATGIDEEADVEILNFLWTLQEVCLGYYENIGENGQTCPPDVNCIVRTCPTGISPNANGDCECANGTWETGC